jgi:hypothetical protein
LANLKALFWEDQKADGWTQNYFYRGLEIILYQVSINERKVRKPVVLFVDGHTSHINLEVVKLSKHFQICQQDYTHETVLQGTLSLVEESELWHSYMLRL